MANEKRTDIGKTVIRIVSALVNKETAARVTLESRLKHDLGFDSLKMLELCVTVEGALNVSIEKKMAEIVTVNDVVTLIENDDGNRVTDHKIDDYPLPKTERYIQKLKRYMRLSHILWHFEVFGLENIPVDRQYILCPNHQSHFDSMWIWSAIAQSQPVDLHKICCLAKQEHLESSFTRSWLTMLGGIPVDRNGNTIPAMQRGLAALQDGYSMLIHPEGTRTKDGKIHEFKGGAAKLAIDANVSLIPVRIEGAWNIFPPHRKLPRVFRFGRRYPIKIQFGKPIEPDGKSVEKLTGLVQSEVERMGNDL